MTRLRAFYILAATQAMSLIGSRMASIAISIQVYRETGQAAPLLLVSFFNELPAMLGGSLAGVLADRWDRRHVLMAADAGQAAGSLLLMLSFVSGQFQLWHLYAVSLLQGIFAMFQEPARDAAITMLVPDSQRDRANALQQMSFPLAGVIAPALTGLLFPFIGIAGVILIDLVTFCAAVGVVWRTDIPRPARSAESHRVAGRFWSELRAGISFLASRRGLLILVLYFTVLNFLLNGPLGLSIPYLLAVTGSEALSGLLLAAMNLGALTGAVIIALRPASRRRVHVFMPALLLTGVMFMIYGTSRQPLVMGLSLYLLMIALPLSWGLFTSILQLKVPPDMQARAFSVFGQLGYLAATASFLLTGPLVDRVLEPAVGTPAWRPVTALVGDRPGAGMGLVLVGSGVIILLLTGLVYTRHSVRHIETALPDYSPGH